MENNQETYSIKEVANLIDEEQHVIRYWEREFSQLHPQKNISGNRIYSKKDLALLQYLKKLFLFTGYIHFILCQFAKLSQKRGETTFFHYIKYL